MGVNGLLGGFCHGMNGIGSSERTASIKEEGCLGGFAISSAIVFERSILGKIRRNKRNGTANKNRKIVKNDTLADDG